MASPKLSDADILSAFTAGAKASQAAPDGKLSDDQILGAFTSYAPSKSDAKSAGAKSFSREFGAGVTRGAKDVVANFPGAANPEEVGALASQGIQPPSPDEARAFNREEAQAFDKEHGDSSAASLGRFTGNAALTAPLMAMAGAPLRVGAEAVSQAAPRLAPVINFLSGKAGGEGALNRLTGVASKATAGAETGAAANVLSTGASEDSLGERAGEGAAVGATIGGGVPIAAQIGKLAGKAAAGVANPVVDRLFRGPDSSAARKLLQAMERDEISPIQLENRLAELGGNAAVVDAGGANVRGLAEAAANSPGKGAQKASNFLQGRMEGQGNRLVQATNEATGSTGGYYNAVDAMIEKRSADAAPKYAKAFEAGPVHSEYIERFLQDPVAKQGLRQGLEIQRLEALKNRQPFSPADYAVTGFNEAGDPMLGKVPNMRTLDAVKRGMDDMLEQYRDKTTGKLVLDAKGRALDGARKEFVKELDTLNPDYKAAREAWSGPSQALDALAMGRNALAADPEVTAKTISNLSETNKLFFKTGVARAIKEKVEGTADGNDAVRKIFGNESVRNKLKAAFDDEKAFDRFAKTMEAEGTFTHTRNEVLKGSQTARRLAAQGDMDLDPSPLIEAGKGNLVRAGVGALRQGYQYLKRPPAEQANSLADMLFNPANNGMALQALRARGPSIASRLVGNRLVRGVAPYGVPAGVIGSNRLTPEQ